MLVLICKLCIAQVIPDFKFNDVALADGNPGDDPDYTALLQWYHSAMRKFVDHDNQPDVTEVVRPPRLATFWFLLAVRNERCFELVVETGISGSWRGASSWWGRLATRHCHLLFWKASLASLMLARQRLWRVLTRG